MSGNRTFDYAFFYKRRQDLVNSRNQYLNNINGQRIIFNPQLSDWNASRQATFVDGAQTMVFRGTYGNGETVSVGGIVNIPPYPVPTGPTITVPSAPIIDTIDAGDTELLVYFSSPSSNGGSEITDYEYSRDNGTSFISAGSTTSPITISGLTNGQTYQVLLRAVNSVGSGPNSNVVSGTPVTRPSAPTITSIISGNQQLTVAFTAGATGGSDITNYKYSTDDGTTFRAFSPTDTTSPVIITTLSIDGTTPLTNGTTYQIRLLAVNANGDGTASSASPGVPSAPPAPGTQLLINPEFTDIVSNGANGWSSSQGWDPYSGTLANSPTAVINMPIRTGVYPTSSSTGFVILSFVSATISQTVTIGSLEGINTITGILNIANVANNATDTFTFQIQYKNSSGAVLYTTTTGNILAPSTWTDYTLTLTRAASPNFDLIKSITVNITGIDSGYWNGQYGPAMDYCRLTVS